MKIETKYSVGSYVWAISSKGIYRIVRCQTCSSSGKIFIQSEEFVCPKCEGRAAHPQYGGHKWFISHKRAYVGEIRVEYNSNRHYDKDAPNMKIQYMLDCTGIGSGNLWYENELCDSEESAIAECERRNANVNWENETEMLPPVLP